MGDQKISSGTLFSTSLYHHFLSGIRSFFRKSSSDIQEVQDDDGNHPAPSISISVRDIEPQMFLNSNYLLSAETSVASPAFPKHPSAYKGDNSHSIFSQAHSQEETLAASSSSSFSSLSSFSSSSMSMECDNKEAKPPWVHDSYKSNLKSSNISSPAHESSSTPEGKETTRVDQNSEQTALHPIIWNFRNQELGRNLLLLAVPMIIALSTFDNPKNVPTAILVTAVALSFGVALIWNAILLRKTWHNISNWIEILGVAFMLLAFYRFVACFLHKTLIWIPVLCWFLNLLPFAVAYISRERVFEKGDTVQTSTEFLV